MSFLSGPFWWNSRSLHAIKKYAFNQPPDLHPFHEHWRLSDDKWLCLLYGRATADPASRCATRHAFDGRRTGCPSGFDYDDHHESVGERQPGEKKETACSEHSMRIALSSSKRYASLNIRSCNSLSGELIKRRDRNCANECPETARRLDNN